jgi:hypothetical protein
MIRNQDRLLKGKWQATFEKLPEDSKVALKQALFDLHHDSLIKANHSWKKHKAPMALYWKVVGVYAGHLARSIKTK